MYQDKSNIYKASVLAASLALWLGQGGGGWASVYPWYTKYIGGIWTLLFLQGCLLFEPCLEKPCLSDSQPGTTQAILHGHRGLLDIR